MPSDWLRPEWDAPRSVRALMSTRQGGVSSAPFDSLNLACNMSTGQDRHPDVEENRRRFAAELGAEPVYLSQVHGCEVVAIGRDDLASGSAAHRADASITTVPGVACVALVADCLPVLFCTRDGRAVGAAHAGWRGLAAGVLQNTVARLCELAGSEADAVSAWLGPCIGPRRFEVGADVVAAFRGLADPAHSDPGFRPCRRHDGSAGWLADLPRLACEALAEAGVHRVHGGTWCTVEDPLRFFSFRRDGVTGRLAAAIALAD
jgi:YfiH family protein